jgi:hypothetical protein
MSTRRGGTRSRKPKHQNTFAFKHNKNSKKTKKILKLPNVTLNCCPRCVKQINWKIKYRKYKPVKQPSKCNSCKKKTVLVAYHALCRACSKKLRKCAKCNKSASEWGNDDDGAIVADKKGNTTSAMDVEV